MNLYVINRKSYIAALASGQSTEQIVENSKDLGQIETKSDHDKLKYAQTRGHFTFIVQNGKIISSENIQFN